MTLYLESEKQLITLELGAIKEGLQQWLAEELEKPKKAAKPQENNLFTRGS